MTTRALVKRISIATHDMLPAARDGFPLFLLGITLVYSNRWFTVDYDEVSVLRAAAQPLYTTSAIFRSGIGQHEHPPLHDLLMHVWLVFTGGAFDWLRAPSIAFFLGGLFLLSRAARRIAGQTSATVLIWLGVLWPFGFHFGRLAIWYSFAFLVISALTWAYLRFCESPTGYAWALVWFLEFALVCTNYFGWALLTLLGVDDWIRHHRLPGTSRRLVWSAALLVIAYIPLWPAFLGEFSYGAHPIHSWRGLMLSLGFSAYTLLVSESVAPWFWRLGIPATLAVASSLLLVFVRVHRGARRFLLFAGVLLLSMGVIGILNTKRVVLIAPWVLLPMAVAVGNSERPTLRRGLMLSLLAVASIGWYGISSRRYYAAPRFIEPWLSISGDASTALRNGSGVIGNNPSFFFYLTYALHVPNNGPGWRFTGTLPTEVRSEGVWIPEEWLAAGQPLRPKMLWVRGLPGPEEDTPMAAAATWLDQHCIDRSDRMLMPDPTYEWKRRYFPQLGDRDLFWRIEIREYSCDKNEMNLHPAGITLANPR
jgi:hypothetical protein